MAFRRKDPRRNPAAEATETASQVQRETGQLSIGRVKGRVGNKSADVRDAPGSGVDEADGDDGHRVNDGHDTGGEHAAFTKAFCLQLSKF